MIAHLKGILVSKSTNSSIVSCSGVGYEVFHTPFTASKMLESSVELWIHTQVREDAIQLFGFIDLKEREMFRELMRVNGVGPKLAISILSSVYWSDLAHSILQGNLAALTKIPGIGKKTAERLLIELKDRVLSSTTTSDSTPVQSISSELESVFIHLGYTKQEVQRTLRSLETKNLLPANTPLEEMIRIGLKELASSKGVSLS